MPTSNTTRPFAEYVKIVRCADIDVARAKAKAAEHGLGEAKGGSVRELLDDSEVDIVLDLTVPASHALINTEALRAGKHVYTEKPFSLCYPEGRSHARRKNGSFGSAARRIPCSAAASRPAAN